MDVIKKARELGKVIQEDARYKQYNDAKKKNDEDKELQDMIGEFNLKRVALNTEMTKPEKDDAKIASINEEIQALYNKVMANENMVAFSNAKDEMDSLLNKVNMVITMSANGEDPETCPVEEPASCSGSCSSCGGCH